jgi:hypothetical protein
MLKTPSFDTRTLNFTGILDSERLTGHQLFTTQAGVPM